MERQLQTEAEAFNWSKNAQGFNTCNRFCELKPWHGENWQNVIPPPVKAHTITIAGGATAIRDGKNVRKNKRNTQALSMCNRYCQLKPWSRESFPNMIASPLTAHTTISERRVTAIRDVSRCAQLKQNRAGLRHCGRFSELKPWPRELYKM